MMANIRGILAAGLTIGLLGFLAYSSYLGEADFTDRSRGWASYLEFLVNFAVNSVGNVNAAIGFAVIGAGGGIYEIIKMFRSGG